MNRNYFGITDPGKIRDNNEDTFIAEQTASTVIAGVIDGVGGYSGGEIASAIARESIIRHLGNAKGNVISLLKNAIAEADDRIVIEKQKDKAHANMACVLTVAVADLEKNQFYYAHVGDTRLYLLRDKSLIKISKDQSFVGFMEDSGRLTEEQAMRHPKRNEINKALGFGVKISSQDDYIETGQSPFLPGDLILICSDGLSDMVNKQGITDILIQNSTLEEKSKTLIEAANKNGGLDNITVVLVFNDKISSVHEITKPTSSLKKTINTSTPERIQEALPLPQQEFTVQQPVQKKSTGILTLLSLLCLIFLLSTAYLIWQHYIKPASAVQQHKLGLTKLPLNTQEAKLQDTLNKLKGNTLTLTDSMFNAPIVITESLVFNKDTLFIKAKNNVSIICDTAFKGKAIVIKPMAKLVALENITFEGFSTAISSSQNTSLVLKNIRFNNGINAVETIYNLPPKKYVNGKIARSTFKTDSVPTPLND